MPPDVESDAEFGIEALIGLDWIELDLSTYAYAYALLTLIKEVSFHASCVGR